MFSQPVLIARGLDLQYAGLSLYPSFSVQFSGCVSESVGVFNDEGPPVPIPNTEVKLISAEDTCLETDRKNRSMPTQKTSDRNVWGFYFVFGQDREK